MKLKSFIATWIVALCCIPILAQVGIGTTNPLNDFHVAGGVRIDSLPEMPTAVRYLVADANGDIGWNDGSNLITRPNLVVVNEVPGVGVTVASNTAGVFSQQGIPLVDVDVNIQGNSIAVLSITYKVPFGVTNGNNKVGTLATVRFYEDGSERTWLGSEVLVQESSNPNSVNGALLLTATYYTVVINNTATPVTKSFAIEGAIFQSYSGDTDTEYTFTNKMSFSYKMEGYSN